MMFCFILKFIAFVAMHESIYYHLKFDLISQQSRKSMLLFHQTYEMNKMRLGKQWSRDMLDRKLQMLSKTWFNFSKSSHCNYAVFL